MRKVENRLRRNQRKDKPTAEQRKKCKPNERVNQRKDGGLRRNRANSANSANSAHSTPSVSIKSYVLSFLYLTLICIGLYHFIQNYAISLVLTIVLVLVSLWGKD